MTQLDLDDLAITLEVTSMLSWQEYLRNSPIEWLLEKENPSIRYLTLHDLLDKAEDDHQVVETKAAIPSSDILVKILSNA